MRHQASRSASDRRRSALRVAAVLLALAGCAKPPPDLDGEPGGARLLDVGQPRTDQLHCKGGDCSDWYRVRVERRGELVIHVAALDEDAATTSYSLQLHSGRNEPLGYGDAAGLGRKELLWRADPGVYLVGIGAPAKSGPFHYEVLVSFRPEPPPRAVAPPPPPEPRFEPISAEVLEVEGQPSDPRAVLIDRGRGDGLRPGLRGRLLENGAEIATVEIVDVYADGSRARIEGPLQAPITAHTRAEIDVPMSGAPRAAPTELDESAPRPD
ncbi:MAG: hypothetical protein OEM05_06255 [Myxococcales bacterium]|nr:hypothetical protein [Myxococcales bacterium]